MSTPTPAGKILIAEILNGDYDGDLEGLAMAVRMRRNDTNKFQERVKFAAFKKGDTVRFNLRAQPRYLTGHTAKITEVFRTKVGIVFTKRVGKFMPGATVRCPVGIIDKVEKVEKT